MPADNEIILSKRDLYKLLDDPKHQGIFRRGIHIRTSGAMTPVEVKKMCTDFHENL